MHTLVTPSPWRERAVGLGGLWALLNHSVAVFCSENRLSGPLLVMTAMQTSYATLVVLCYLIS